MLPFPSPMLLASAAGGGGGALGAGPSIRGSNLVATGNVSSYNLAFPAGAQAGDLLVGYMGHGWNTWSVGSGQGTWTIDETKNGSNINGAIWHKVLDASDITRGYVTLVWTNGYYGVAGCVCFVGAPTGIRTFSTVRDGASASSESVSTNSSPQTGDYAILFGLTRANVTVTVTGSPGTALQSLSSNEASGVSRLGTLTAGGVISETYNFSGGTSGEYVGVVIIQP